MRRSVLLPASAVLAVLTALACLGVAGALRPPGSTAGGTPGTAASRQAAVRFYEAINAAIATGDLKPFEAVVAPDFVDRRPIPAFGPDRAGLGRYLQSLHATVSGASVSPETIVAEGDRVMVAVRVRGIDDAGFLGLPLPTGELVWGTVDVLRVVDGRIAERWATTSELSLLEPLGLASLGGQPLPAHPVVTLDRLSLRPGDRLDAWSGGGVEVVHVETGRLGLAVDPAATDPASGTSGAPPGAAPDAIGAGTEVVMARGETAVVPPRTGFALRGEGGEPTDVLIVGIASAEEAAKYGPPASAFRSTGASGSTPAIAIDRLAGGLSTMAPGGRGSVALGRVTLAPGASIPAHQATGAELLVVEDGSLYLRTEGGEAWVTDGAYGISAEVAEADLAAGDGTFVRSGTTVALRNLGDDPLVLLVVTILPDEGA